MDPLADFHPLVRTWFEERFPEGPSEPQRLGWPAIRTGSDVLVSAPTGSGKTLAAFLLCLDELVRKAERGELPPRAAVLYVSPLKALGNDVHRNLEVPLAEIGAAAVAKGIVLEPIRAAVRTGDTLASERASMLRRPPHVLVTTPESLFILLTAERSRRLLEAVRTVIVDEIHAVADDKRGAHLALSLERLDALVRGAGGRRPQRIGLSATVRPVEEVARFLSPTARIVDVGHRREMELAVEVPRDELGAVASNEMWEEIYDRLAEHIAANRTTLVFVNTRRLAERVAHRLRERLGEEAVVAHHGSLSRTLRLDAERRLKEGRLRAVVATASLELGIDIGTVDLVCQIGSPRSMAVALQRIGRSGHWRGARSRGVLFATTRDELVECAALARALLRGGLDRLTIPEGPLDILAQQIVAAAAAEEWDEDALFALVRRAYPYRSLRREDFDAVVAMHAEGIGDAGRRRALLHRDGVHRRIKGRRGARLAAITSGGAIPERATYLVVAEPEGNVVGTLDEDFAIESLAGDVFLLGTTSWRIRRVESGRVRVEDARGAAPTIPFWRGEAPGRTAELSEEVARLREDIARAAEVDREQAVRLLVEEARVERRGAEQAVDYVQAGRAALGVVPTQKTVVAERFFDEAGGMQLVLHAPFGTRVNRAWGLALRKRFCRSFNLELQAAATDDGIVISLSDRHSFPLEAVFGFVRTPTAAAVLRQAILPTPLFAVRWRWNATRSLAVLRFAGGRRVPPPIQRMRSDDLLAAVFPDQAACAENLSGEVRIPDHPLVRQTIDDTLHEAMDEAGFLRLLAAIEAGEIRTVARETAEPSPFSHEILNANPYAFLDDAPLEERRARAVQMRRTLPAELLREAGGLSREAIAEVEEESWPAVRDRDELHDALLGLALVPPLAEWQPYFDELVGAGRAATLVVGDRSFWVAAERARWAERVQPEARFEPRRVEAAAGGRDEAASTEEAAARIVGGWLESTGPRTVSWLAGTLALRPALVEAALARLEGEGKVLRGSFTGGDGETEWCDRRLLARIHRRTLGRLRREIEPVTTAELMRFFFRWQHVATGTRLHGEDGLFEVLRQLQGYELPAAAWESAVLPARVADYRPELLDRLCLSGEIVWGRFSPHRALESDAGGRVRPTRIAPIGFLLREEMDDALAEPATSGPAAALSAAAREVLRILEARGASFFGDLRRATGRLASELEDALWELAAAGLVTADGFENLRALVDPKRRRGEGRGRTARPRHAAGRWSLLRSPGASARTARSPVEDEARLEGLARRLLARWGVVFRDLLARETVAPAWRDLLVVLRKMEARGEVRGGRFVSGTVGEQYALPEALELLRVVRRSEPDGETLRLGAADPLNLLGIVLPGPRVSPLASEPLVFRDGVPVDEEPRRTARRASVGIVR